MIFIYLINLLFYLSVCGFCLNYYYYLSSLLMMEFIVVSLMSIMLFSAYGLGHFFIYILILSVCDSVMGLLLMILICRVWGSDKYLLIDYSV